MSNGHINAVQLAAKHLHRVARYDRRGPRLNAIPVLNLNIFEHAQESDEFRASNNGSRRSMLEGIPGTLKDSYMMAGMTVGSGSPAFQNLTASADAFTVGRLREGGGIIFGKTNMPPMANGGMQRGLYGRAESPYNKEYLTAAYASGSSNGAASSISASLVAFEMGEETVSSGRSPASNNGLVAYTPSRGVLSIRGNWPLFPIADVPVPYARTVQDMLNLLDVLVQDDEDKTSDFWRGQPFVTLPPASSIRPSSSYQSLAKPRSLTGKRIGVPKMYIGEHDPAAQPTWVSPAVKQLWARARDTLESVASVQEADFPLETNFEAPGIPGWPTEYPLPGRTNDSSLGGPSEIDAYSWDDFLKMVNDTAHSGITGLAQVEPSSVFPQLPHTLPDRYGNRFMNRTSYNTMMIETVSGRKGTNIYDLPGLGAQLRAIEARRKRDLEDWMDELGLDVLVWPSVGDVGRADAEINNASADLTWHNGVFFSNGNYAIREFGVPTVSVSMGIMNDTQMPVDLTFASKAYNNNALLSYAFAFEQTHEKRKAPPLTPELPTDIIPEPGEQRPISATKPPKLTAKVERLCIDAIEVSGSVNTEASGGLESLEVFVDGVSLGPIPMSDSTWSFLTRVTPYDDPVGDVPVRVVNVPDQSLAMVVIVATAKNGRSDGKMLFV